MEVITGFYVTAFLLGLFSTVHCLAMCGSVIGALTLSLPMPEAAAQDHTFILPTTGIKLAQVEVDLIEQALNLSAVNRSKAAPLLGISRDTLLYRMQKHEL